MLAGRSGSRWIPRKIAGSEMITIELSSVAMNMPRVVFDRAVHLYRSSRAVIEALLREVDVHVKINSLRVAGTASLPNAECQDFRERSAAAAALHRALRGGGAPTTR